MDEQSFQFDRIGDAIFKIQDMIRANSVIMHPPARKLQNVIEC